MKNFNKERVSRKNEQSKDRVELENKVSEINKLVNIKIKQQKTIIRLSHGVLTVRFWNLFYIIMIKVPSDPT